MLLLHFSSPTAILGRASERLKHESLVLPRQSREEFASSIDCMPFHPNPGVKHSTQRRNTDQTDGQTRPGSRRQQLLSLAICHFKTRSFRQPYRLPIGICHAVFC